MKIINSRLIVLLVTALMASSSYVYADRGSHKNHGDRGDKGFRGQLSESLDRGHDSGGHDKDFHWDKRYHHDRHYPREGFVVRGLPERHHRVHYRNHDYFYLSGIWYEPSGVNFVVVRPPIGIVVPILPPAYSTVWLHDRPYYYANDVYYAWRPEIEAYEVVSPPTSENEQEPPLMADEMFIYPKHGQNEQQQANDRYDCHRWGVDQTSYDPTRPPENATTSELNDKRDNYQRAMKACLEGKGYSVR